MALLTGGSSTTSVLAGIKALVGTATAADGAALRANILDDLNVAHPIWPDAYHSGRLFIPNRGVLKVLPGDYVFYDPNGWPILVSANSIAGSGWSHS
jgi:hypothetical protein